MPKLTPSIKTIENNSKSLMKIDINKEKDYKITKKEYEEVDSDKDLIKSLTGSKSIKNWEGFKEAFLEFQKQIGFKWDRVQGQGGPLQLESFTIPGEVGEELAETLMQKKQKEGDFRQELESKLSETFKYLSEFEESDGALIDITEARNAFKEYEMNNESYKFSIGRSSVLFSKAIKKYTYKGSESQKSEDELGKAITNKLKENMVLDYLQHSQLERKHGKYENVDFEGFKIKRMLNEDRFDMYSFELKPSNGIEYVSSAINQAINYQRFSNYTYIIIPLFDPSSYYDTDRFYSFIELCRTNNVGVLSINVEIKNNEHEIIDINEVISPPRLEIEDYSHLVGLVENSEYEFCPLCRKIVRKGTEKQFCGWKVVKGEDTICMKDHFESLVKVTKDIEK